MTDPKTHAQVAVKPTPEALIGLIGEMGREVHYMLDDCETSGDVGDEVHTITTYGLEQVSAVLDRIEALPFQEPGYILGPGAMLEAALKQTFMVPSEKLRENIAQLIHQDQKQLLSAYGVHPEVYQSDPELYSSAEALTDTIIHSALVPTHTVPVTTAMAAAACTCGHCGGLVCCQNCGTPPFPAPAVPDDVAEIVAELREWDHCWPAKWLEGAVTNAADALEAQAAKLARLNAALTEIANITERKESKYPADWQDQIAACPECQRYKDHPIQQGICDDHRKPIYAQRDHDSNETLILGYRAKSIARAALTPTGDSA